jgi:hypothetical protein
VANEWRSVCGVAGFSMPAAATARLKDALEGLVEGVVATRG